MCQRIRECCCIGQPLFQCGNGVYVQGILLCHISQSTCIVPTGGKEKDPPYPSRQGGNNGVLQYVIYSFHFLVFSSLSSQASPSSPSSSLPDGRVFYSKFLEAKGNAILRA